MMQGYNFTERVRTVFALAREAAEARNHEYVGTEHILLGLIGEGGGVANAVLQNLRVDRDGIVARVDAVVRKGKTRATGPDLPYTSRAKKVLEFAMHEARNLNHSYVGTEHILLGLMAEEKGIAAQVLADAGLKLDEARTEVLRLLGTEPSTSRRPRPTSPSRHPTPPPGRTGLAVTQVTIVTMWEDGKYDRQDFGTVREAIEHLRSVQDEESARGG